MIEKIISYLIIINFINLIGNIITGYIEIEHDIDIDKRIIYLVSNIDMMFAFLIIYKIV